MKSNLLSKSPTSQLILFFGLSLMSWLIWIPQAAQTLGYRVSAVPQNSPANVLAVWAPGLAAILVCALATGKAGVRELLRPLRFWRIGIGWYVFAILFPTAQWAVALGIDRLLGRSYELGRSPVFEALGPQAAALLPFLILFALPGALGEELGWRGFALPKLQTRQSALVASIILGLFWGLWHVPTWMAQEPDGLSLWPILVMVVSTVPAAIIFTWIYNNTHGSLLPVCLLHASIAITGYLLPALPTSTANILSWIAAIIIIAATGPRHFSPTDHGKAPHEDPGLAKDGHSA